MGAGASNTDNNIFGKCNLDSTELYGPDGQTIADIENLSPKELLDILDIKKNPLQRVQNKIKNLSKVVK